MATAKNNKTEAMGPDDRAEALKALGHPSRLMMVEALATRGELCVCELQRLVGADMSTVSRHLGSLKRAGLVSDRRQGTWIHYSLASEAVAALGTHLGALAAGKA
jgi:DNA-binding transcriptional ArsR family regulator